jgi:hypothetical protein
MNRCFWYYFCSELMIGISKINLFYLKVNCMKIIGYFVIVLLAVSCLKPGKDSYYVHTTGRVEITQVDIPETAIVNQYIEIKARAEESNGCWSNLNFTLTKNNDYEYSLEAFGIFESTGYCADIKVYGDTTIAFKPTITGKYIFHTIKSESEVQSDTLIVSNEI